MALFQVAILPQEDDHKREEGGVGKGGEGFGIFISAAQITPRVFPGWRGVQGRSFRKYNCRHHLFFLAPPLRYSNIFQMAQAQQFRRHVDSSR